VIIDTGVFGARWFTGTVSGGRRIFYHPGDQPASAPSTPGSPTTTCA
jgi:hypothetical protein